MKRIGTILVCCCLLALAASSARAYEAIQGPTELRYWDATQANNGYTMTPGNAITVTSEKFMPILIAWG